MTAPARLRQLRLVGFKSFAERTVVEFGAGISAVVGPNGSGKSNLADALRWALGEQGRSLRTRKSEDVIFAGSANRRATGMADVTLVVDNVDGLLPVDFSEIELGRRLFRSGENEYLLNRQRVRLRDLVELLDSANLADNAFLFIGQGMVDQALSLRPEERRPLFEEAAGVRRHERRRRGAEESLTQAETNLSRVRDVLGELRPQLRRLAAQAEQQAARSTAAEELADAVVGHARARWRDADRAERAAAGRAADARAASERALGELRTAEEAATALAARLAERAVAERERRAELDAVRSRIVELRLTEGRATAEREGRMRDRERLTAERDVLVRRVTKTRAAASAPPVPIDVAAEDAVADLDREIAAAAAELERARASGEREASLRRASAAREAELERLQRAEREAAARARDAAERARLAAEAAETAGRVRDEAVQRLDAASATERAAEAALESTRSATAEAEGMFGARAAAAAESRRRHDDAAARLRSLDEGLDAIDGRGAAAAARRRGGTLLAEGAEVDPALRTAVEAALGAAASAVLAPADVVRAVGSEAGALVVKEASGAARGNGTAAAAALAAAADALAAAADAGGGALADAVRHDPQGALTALLATAVWVPDIDAALAVLPSLPAGWRAATKGGDVVSADGVVELGRAGSTLARRAERETLAAQLERLRAASDTDARDAESAARDLDRARSSEDEARRVLAEAQAQRRSADETARAAERRADLTAREAAWEDAQRDRLAREHARLHDDLARMPRAPAEGTASPGRNDAATQWVERLEDLRRRRRDIASALDASRLAHREAEDRRRRAEVTLAIDEARLEAIETELGRLASLDEEARNIGAPLGPELATAREQEKAAAAAVEALGAADADERRRLAALEADASAARERLRSAGERGRAAELAEVQARLALEGVRESLLVELAALGPVGLRALNGDAHADAAADVHEDAMAAEMEAALACATDAWRDAPGAEAPSSARLALLRRRFHDVGAANPFAAQEHAELKERVDALEAQASDLVEAIDSTRRLIAELAALITDRFQQTFAALEQAFARQFELLFGGGDARLELTAPDDLTQTGVEILARPPGKKRQPLSMLSGGERALTAVALLFAMLEVRPVPFCVLDEVDAALDEANINRFAASLRALADRTQFIVITHNRGTIESADALYGVTIGDDAVSRVISLRLADATDVPALREPAGTAA